MKKHSCGAILYIIENSTVYIILGMEKNQWFPFKGIRERGETNDEAAIREINEETCGAVIVNHIELKCNYTTKRKHYHIGLVRIYKNQFINFYRNRDYMLNTYDNRTNFLEKNKIKMFEVETIMLNDFHEITITPIMHYLPFLNRLQNNLNLRRKIVNVQTSSEFDEETSAAEFGDKCGHNIECK